MAPETGSRDQVALVSVMHLRDLEAVRLQPALDQSQQLEDQPADPDSAGCNLTTTADPAVSTTSARKWDTASPSSARALSRSGAVISTGVVRVPSHHVVGRALSGLGLLASFAMLPPAGSSWIADQAVAVGQVLLQPGLLREDVAQGHFL